MRVITRLDVHGGAELSTLVELEELAALDHDIMVVTLSEPTTPAAVDRLEQCGVAHRHLDGSVGRQAVELRRLARSWQPDVLHAVIFRAELVTALAAVGSGCTTVVSLVNMQYDPAAVAQAPTPWKLELVRRWESLVLRRGFDRFHCLTDAGARHSVDRLGIDAERITVIPRGRRRESLAVDPGDVARVRAELAPSGRPLVVNVGRHELQKGQDLLLECAVMWRATGLDVSIAIAGRAGNRTAQLETQIDAEGLGEQVQLLGARPDVPTLLSAADVVCVTSRWEGLGGSIIESLGVGAPIVVFGVDAVQEVVGDAGVSVPPFDVAAYAGAVRALLGDDARRSSLAASARRRFDEEFELGGVVRRIEEWYALAVAAERSERSGR